MIHLFIYEGLLGSSFKLVVDQLAASASCHDHVRDDCADHTPVSGQVLDHQRVHTDRVAARIEQVLRVEGVLGGETLVEFQLELGVVACIFEAFKSVKVTLKSGIRVDLIVYPDSFKFRQSSLGSNSILNSQNKCLNRNFHQKSLFKRLRDNSNIECVCSVFILRYWDPHLALPN